MRLVPDQPDPAPSALDGSASSVMGFNRRPSLFEGAFLSGFYYRERVDFLTIFVHVDHRQAVPQVGEAAAVIGVENRVGDHEGSG